MLAVLTLSSVACVKRVDSVTPKTLQLLQEAPERETEKILETSKDFEFDTKDRPREAHVVAKGESPLLESNGGRVRLFGDAAGKTGISVDSVLLLEIVAADGKVLDRVAVGFTEGLIMGNEHIDLLGRQAFNFEPGEVNLSTKVPEKGGWKLRATVLDNYGVGRVSDVYVMVDAGEATGDDLRAQ
jgi:hypothetical protein